MRPLSTRNPRVQRLTRLVRRPEERAEQRAFVVEGPILLGAALDGGVRVLDVYVDESAVAARAAVRAVLDRLPPGVEPWVLPAGALERIGDATTSQGVVGVVEQREAPWPSPDTGSFVLLLAELADPGNMGTLIRAAVAAGAGAVVVAGGVDPTSPKVVRASAGSVFATDVVRAPSAEQAADRLRAVGYRVLGTVVGGGTPYDEVDLTGPVAVVLGNEAHGLAPEVAARLDALVTIPMAGPTESLNVAMAGSVLCFEVLRQRRHAAGPTP